MNQPDILTTSAASSGQPAVRWTRLQMDCMVDLGLIIAQRLYPEAVHCRNKRPTGAAKTSHSAVAISAPLEQTPELRAAGQRGDEP